MPEANVTWFQEHYSQMDEDELMKLARAYDELSEPAQEALRAEFSHRSLEPPLLDEEPEIELVERSVVTIALYRDMPEAFVARSVLEAEGIECFLADENLVRMDWFLSNLIGGMRLQVDARDEERAKELLSQPMPENIPFREEEVFDQPVCPACSSLKVLLDDADRKVLAASMLLGIPLPHRRPPKNRLRCQNCGFRWEDDEA